MHQIFEQELYKFRIRTAKEFLKSLQTASTPISTNPNEPIRLNAHVNRGLTFTHFLKNFIIYFKVQGIGPKFKLILKVQNISTSTPLVNLFVTFNYDETLYKIAQSYIQVSISYDFKMKIF